MSKIKCRYGVRGLLKVSTEKIITYHVISEIQTSTNPKMSYQGHNMGIRNSVWAKKKSRIDLLGKNRCLLVLNSPPPRSHYCKQLS